MRPFRVAATLAESACWKHSDDSSTPIAGETLMGVAIKLYIAAPGLVSQLWSQLQNLGGAK